MGNSATTFDLDDLKQCVDKDPSIGEFVPITGSITLFNDIMYKYWWHNENIMGKNINFYLDHLGPSAATYRFKERHAKIIRDTLFLIQNSHSDKLRVPPSPRTQVKQKRLESIGKHI